MIRPLGHLASASALALAVLFGGCASRPVATGVPDDFSLDAAVLPPAAARDTDQAQHFVLHADGSLHAGQGRFGDATHYPGQARHLSSQQMAELLSLARRAITDAATEGPTSPVQWLHEQPLPEAPVLLLWVRDGGVESAARFDGVDGALPPAAELLRRRLSDLALMR